MQRPPAYSAVKVGGERLYAKARRGEAVEVPPRPVTVHRAECLWRAEDRAEFEIECSSGTYVRALARDLGATLGVGGHLTALRRTRVGPYGLHGARTLDELAGAPGLSAGLDEVVTALFPHRAVDGRQARVLAHGGSLPACGLTGTYAAIDSDGGAVALLAERDDQARPILVLRPAGE